MIMVMIPRTESTHAWEWCGFQWRFSCVNNWKIDSYVFLTPLSPPPFAPAVWGDCFAIWRWRLKWGTASRKWWADLKQQFCFYVSMKTSCRSPAHCTPLRLSKSFTWCLRQNSSLFSKRRERHIWMKTLVWVVWKGREDADQFPSLPTRSTQ